MTADLQKLEARGLLRRLGTMAGKVEDKAHFPFGLGQAGLHEIVETSYGDMPAAAGFLLAASTYQDNSPLVWITQTRLSLEHGRLQADSLCAMAPNVGPILFVETQRSDETLWCVEEALRANGAGLVVAEVDQADFTATRRLALACETNGGCAVLLMPYHREGTTAAAIRWRISARTSAANPHDFKAPGHPRWCAQLERCRPAPHLAGQTFDLEFDDETLSCAVATRLATRSVAPRKTSLPPRHRGSGRESAPFRHTG